MSETLIFIMYLSAIATWYLSLLRPYISQLNLEMSRVAALLSFLPVGVDLQKLMSIHNQRRAR
ncbi:hypothetical protein EON66_03480 [archaeon]|nr:MAG: hypothetical protein EON66_03480 [archaeon]